MSEISNKSSETLSMSSVAEASSLIRSLAEPRPVGDLVKTAMGRAGRRLAGWSNNRVRDVWLADRRIRISSEEMDTLRAAARQHREAHVADRYTELTVRLARLEAALVQERTNDGC